MVKRLDDKSNALPDHVGWRLWQANRAWLQAFVGGMRAAGHEWFSERAPACWVTFRAVALGNRR